MRLLYLVNQRLPIEKAYGLQIVKMAEAFAGLGLDVELVAPMRKDPIRKGIFEYFGVKSNFRATMIPSLDFYLPGRLDILAVRLKSFFSAIQLFLFSVSKKHDVIYSRDELPLYFLSFFKKNLIFEAHKFSEKRNLFYKRFKKRRIKIVAISDGIKNEFEKIGFTSFDLLTAHDAVDLRDFDIDLSKNEARQRTSLALDKKIAVYSGHLFKWKGVDTLVEAARILPEVLFVIIGGTEEDVKNHRTSAEAGKIGNILFLGHKPHRQVPLYLKAADVLILPNNKEEKISKLYTSPLKLFEYMASKRPIVASDLPSIREVLNEDCAVFFEPGRPIELATAVKRVINDDNLALALSSKAFEKVQNHTWQKRAQKILAFIA